MRYLSVLQSVGVLRRRPSQSTAGVLSATPGNSVSREGVDDELPAGPAIFGLRGRRLLWTIGLLALALRIILIPIGHAWDLTIDYDMFIDLARNHSPYDTFNFLAHIAQSAEWDHVYEYYAYPPVPLYLYYPLAKIFILLHPHATYFFPQSFSYAAPPLPLDFFVLFKLPIWIADFLIAALLARMTGLVRTARDYLLNPYVLLISGAWTFDAIMVLGIVAGAYFIYKQKYAYAGIALAFGTMVKFFPILALPTFLIYMIKKERHIKDILIFLASYGIACLVFLGPFLQGVLEVLSFHSGRMGGGITWQVIWSAWAFYPPNLDLNPLRLAIGDFGTPILLIVLLLTYWYIWQREMTFNRMIITTLVGFFIGSKLINEQYVLMLFPFVLVEAQRLKGIWRWFSRLFWIIPFTFAAIHVPIDRFMWLLYHMLLKGRAEIINTRGLTGFEWNAIPWQHPKDVQILQIVIALFFLAFCIVVFLWPPKPIHYLRRRKEAVETQPDKAPDGSIDLVSATS